MESEKYYYVDKSGDVVGPVPRTDLDNLFRVAEVWPKTKVAKVGSQSWVEFETLPYAALIRTDSPSSTDSALQPKEKYPALNALIVVHYVLAVIVGLVAIVMILFSLAEESIEMFLMGFLGGGLLVLVLISSAELFRLLMDIEKNTRKRNWE